MIAVKNFILLSQKMGDGNAANSMRSMEMGVGRMHITKPEINFRSSQFRQTKMGHRLADLISDGKDFEEAILAAVLPSRG